MIDENFKLEHPGWVAQINAQESAYYELMGGDNAKCGNDSDPWNLIGVSWRDYGDASKRDMIYARLMAKVKAAQKIGQDAAAAFYIKEAVKFRPAGMTAFGKVEASNVTEN